MCDVGYFSHKICNLNCKKGKAKINVILGGGSSEVTKCYKGGEGVKNP